MDLKRVVIWIFQSEEHIYELYVQVSFTFCQNDYD